MELTKAIELISPAVNRFKQISSWVDLGSGTGLFTTALAHLLPQGSTVYAVDKNGNALHKLKPFPHVNLRKLEADFMKDVLPLSGLDGILIANALHFVADKNAFISSARQWMNEKGCFILIEYDTDTPNPWVPYPVSFASATKLFEHSGYKTIKKLGTQPSLYQRAGIYAALVERG